MSLISALFTGTSGLRANQKWAEVAGRNIANANTPGYHRKEIQFGSHLGREGGGVYVSDVSRSVDASLTRSYRFEMAKMLKQEAISEGLSEYTAMLGQPDDEKSPASLLSEFKQSMTRLANNPSSVSVQRSVVMAADDFTRSLRETSHALTQAMDENKLAINAEIKDFNEDLTRLAELNQKIHQARDMNADSLELLDERDRIVDRLSESMNLRTVERNDGRITVYTGGGTTLLEGNTAFTLSLDSGSGRLHAGDVDITPGPQNPRGFEFGEMAGLLELRDEILPQFRLQLDEMARSVMEAFEGADASLAPGQAGLFTDAGNAFDPDNLENLASRIAVNDAVKPEKGGELWRVREGVGATSQQGGSFTGQIEDFLAVFADPVSFASGTAMSDLRLEDYANNMISHQAVRKTDADRAASGIGVSVETLGNARASVTGVSIDDQLQIVMLIEQSYSANAQLVQATARMLDQLIEMA